MSITIKRTLCPTGSVENSDATYSNTVDSGGSLVLPDSDVNVNGTLQGTVVSVKDVDVNITDSSGAVTPDSVTIVGNTVTIDVPDSSPTPVGATPLKTLQPISYATGDDGDTQRGRPFFTLPIVGGSQTLNCFGNKWALTGYTGGYYDYDTSQYKDVNGNVTTRLGAFPDYLLVDHRTQNTNGDLLMWYLSSSWLGVPSLDFTTGETTASSLSVAGFSSWYVPNINELIGTFMTYEIGAFPPLVGSYPTNLGTMLFMSSTTYPNNTSNIYTIRFDAKIISTWAKTITGGVFSRVFVRVTNISEL